MWKVDINRVRSMSPPSVSRFRLLSEVLCASRSQGKSVWSMGFLLLFIIYSVLAQVRGSSNQNIFLSKSLYSFCLQGQCRAVLNATRLVWPGWLGLRTNRNYRRMREGGTETWPRNAYSQAVGLAGLLGSCGLLLWKRKVAECLQRTVLQSKPW